MKRYRVLIEKEAQQDLDNIYNFILKNDSKIKAIRFIRELQNAIISLEYMPNRYRKSIYIEQENVRDMIVKGYTIPYLVNDDSVHILAVFRQKSF